MHVGIVGLGRMGRSLGRLAHLRGHEVVGWDPSGASRQAAQDGGIPSVDELGDLPGALPAPRLVLMWVPHGQPVDDALDVLVPRLDDGDVVVDAGNSHWEDSRRRHARLAGTGIGYLDVGTSGGTSDALGWDGAAFMVGGPTWAYEHARPLLLDLAVDDGAVHHVGEQPGVGHFVKLVHNAIEFGMLQAIGEGVELLERSDFAIDAAPLFAHWNHGTVIRSWLVELMGNALATEDAWERLSTHVEDTGEVKWMLTWATDHDIPLPVVSAAQMSLMLSRDEGWPAARAVALLRHQFGGHPVHRRDG